MYRIRRGKEWSLGGEETDDRRTKILAVVFMNKTIKGRRNQTQTGGEYHADLEIQEERESL